MRASRLINTTSILPTLCLAALAANAAPAAAQATRDSATGPEETREAPGSTEESTAAADSGGESIVVTGTRIRSPNLTSSVPVTSLAIGELTDTGNVSLGDELNKLPAMHSTFSQANSTGFIGTSGLNLLDLRGLGTSRTLVMVNGRRHITAQPGTPSSIDVNQIPVELIDRIDIVTGGNSAIYGSDAVAGVVNFVLKRNFDGVRVRGQGGISSHGDRGSYLASITAGRNFAEGRGNVAVAAEYSYADDLYYTDRDGLYGAFSGRRQLNPVQSTIGEPAAGDGIPDQAFLTGVFNGNVSEGGTYASACPAAVASNAPNFSAVQARRALNCTGERSNTGAELGYNFMFDRAGNLLPNICIRDLRPVGSANCIGGQGSSLRLTGQLIPKLERKAINLLAHFDVTPAFSPFIEAKFVRSTGNQEGQPTSIANLQGTYSVNNAFLSAQARDVLARSLAPGATTFAIQRFNVDFGGRGENLRRDTFRLVGGVEGDFNSDWHYELSANYGRLKTHLDAVNRVLLQNFRNAADAVRNPAGQIVCAINADATSANDDTACVPIDVFGFGRPSAAALDYVTANVFRNQKATQLDLLAYLSGDLSQLFELPGGPVGFAFGAEYRRETARSIWDPVTAAGLTDANVIPDFRPPDLKVKEAFAELRIPVLSNMPLAEELSLEGAARVSDYNRGAGLTGTVWTYNVGGIYSPVRDIRFRAGYARSVRAPTQTNLYAVPTQTFLNGLIDPCSQVNINNGSANRAANCRAAGVPTSEIVNGVSVPWTNLPASGIRGLSGSNPSLNAERGRSLTIGAVLQPRFLPGFSLTVDYYDITVKNVINTLAPQTIIDLCYDSSTGIDNPYCAVVFRRPDGTFRGQSNRAVGGSTVQYDLAPNDNSFLAGPFNYAKLKTSGVDFDASYRHRFGSVSVDLRGVLSWVEKRDSYANINDPSFRDRIKSELADPEFAGSFSAKADFGVIDIAYNLRWVGKQTIDAYETTHSVDGRAPTDLDKYPDIWTPNVFYHAVRLGIEPQTGYRFYLGVDNVFDRAPPYGFDGTCATGAGLTCSLGGVGSAIYENVGRFFYAGAELRF